MKKILTFSLAILMICLMSISIYATSEDISPYYNNTIRVSARFQIESSGEAVSTLSYTGYSSCITSAKITSKIQKLVSNEWQDVSGASWEDNFTTVRNTFQHTFQLESTGTYRLVYEFIISGSGGAPDIISDTIEDTY